jgi:alpha-beta hydrolase superfamily lysophospholipase
MRRLFAALAITLLAGCAAGPSPFDAKGSLLRSQLAAASGIEANPAQLLADRIVAADGAELPLRRWVPEQSPRAAIVALHGFNDYSNAFDFAGTALAHDGYAVYAYDQRGFGRAAGRGYWPGSRRLAEDAATAVRLVREKHPGLPVYLMGESMGGAVTMLAATGALGTPRTQVDGVILVAPAVWGRQTMNFFQRAGLWVARQMPALSLSQRSLPITVYPSDNMAMLRAYSADPLVIKETRSDTLNGLVDLMGEALDAAPLLDVPTLVLYGERDEIVPKAPIATMVNTLPAGARAAQRVAYYPKGWHMLFRDLQGGVVVNDVVAWLGDRAAVLPSGYDRNAVLALTGRSPAFAAAN